MGRAVRMSVLLLSSLGLALPAHAERLNGRYLGTLNHVQMNGTSSDRMSHLYDATLRDIITRDVDLDLGISLRYDSQPGVSNTAILRSRFYADVKNTIWRVRSTYVPWQRTQPGNSERRKRDFTFGADLMPRNGPQLHFDFKRADRESELGVTQSSDLRADLTYALRPVRSHLSLRHLESNGASPKTTTDEVRAGVSASHAWRKVSVSGAWDAVATGTEMATVQSDRVMQNAAAGLGWTPHRKVAFTSNVSHRWENFGGDTALMRQSRRTSVTSKATVYPVRFLNVDLTREYSDLDVASGHITTDFLRLTATYVRPLAHQILFRSGYGTHFDLRDQDGDDTRTGVFAAANGRLRQNIQGGAEVRVSHAPKRSSGARWSTSANVQTKPSRLTSFDVRWRSDRSSELPGAQQDDRLWDFTLTYRPTSKVNMNVSHRRQDGSGRVDREERLWGGNVQWRLADRSSARAFASTRTTFVVASQRQEDMFGGDLTFWPTQNFELKTRVQYSKYSDRDSITTFGVNLSHLF